MALVHEPVMVAEVLDLLQPRRGGFFVDCTVGAGGHAHALLTGGATRLLALDRDLEALTLARERLEPWLDRVEIVQADYRELPRLLDERHLSVVDGILADLGVSSLQLDTPGRGFSFRSDEPLDMRMDRRQGETAADWVQAASETELANVIHRYGEERFARRIARAIVTTRLEAPVTTTGQLAAIVRRAIPRRGHQRIDPATRTFQAIRIRVNHELDRLDEFLEAAAERLGAGARLVVVSFHSLEDRIVKHVFRALAARAPHVVRVLTRRPLTPAAAEIARNPRARSAKLRAIERFA